METQHICQSCGMPLTDEATYGTTTDGGKPTDYCLYCYEDGSYTASVTMEEMAKICASHLVNTYKGMTEDEANYLMLDILPALKRWHTDEIKVIKRPRAVYITLNGKGTPELSGDYTVSFRTLYSVFSTLQEIVKTRGQYLAFSAPHTLWHSDQGQDFRVIPRSEWFWCNMLELPSFISKSDLNAAKKILTDLPLAQNVRLDAITEGTCLQVLHIGPYENMCVTVQRLNRAIAERGGKKNGQHHDIYVSDPHVTPPAELTTLIRFPITDEH